MESNQVKELPLYRVRLFEHRVHVGNRYAYDYETAIEIFKDWRDPENGKRSVIQRIEEFHEVIPKNH